MASTKDVPTREETQSPPTDNGKEEQHFRLLIVANRLPITIKKQPDVRLLSVPFVLTS